MAFNDSWHILEDFSIKSYKKFVLCADIGGTNTRIGVFGSRKNKLELIFSRRINTKDIRDQEEFKDIINDILKKVHEAHNICIEDGAFSMAGPLAADRSSCKLTNQPLKIEVSYFLHNTLLARLLLLNDMEVISFSLDMIDDDKCDLVTETEPLKNAPRAIISPGTGLGIGISICNNSTGLYEPLSSEGGHCDIVCDKKLKEYLQDLLKREPDMENIVSGPAITNTYYFVTKKNELLQSVLSVSDEKKPIQIVHEALYNNDKNCIKAVAIFIKNLAVLSRNTSIFTLCYGGLYLCGNITQDLSGLIKTKLFLDEFQKHDLSGVRNVLEQIPIIIVNQKDMPLLGAANAAANFMHLAYKHHRPKSISYDEIILQHIKILRSLQYKSGLFSASAHNVKTGYDKAWLRDNFYECLAFEELGDWETVKRTYRAILDIFKKHEYKLDWAIKNKPDIAYKYIHPRYNPDTFDEFWEEWGNKQNDSIGSILFKVGELEHIKGIKILEDEDDMRIIQKLVYYLESIHYWCDEDNGLWENDEEVHSSSIGSCLAGLKMIKRYTNIDVPDRLITLGEDALNRLLPRESAKRFTDLALLSLIYPYDVVNNHQREEILKNIEYHLVKEKGVIRYKNDWYYNKNPDGFSEEAEWTMGFSWLAIIYKRLGNKERAEYYEKKALETITPEHTVPELYFSNTSKYNENNPLGWAESMFVVSLYEINKKHV